MNKALGKGLSALIPEKAQASSEGNQGNVSFVKLASIQDNRLQPRTDYNDEKLNELKASIKEKGILQPLLVRPAGDKLEVVAGERRLKAARALGLEDVPVIIRELTDREALVIALVENIQREELNPIEEAEAFYKLIEEFEYTQDEVAQSVGKDRSTISNSLRLLKLPDDIKKSLSKGEISAGHARALAGVATTARQKELFRDALKKDLSVRQLEGLIKEDKGPEAKQKPPARAKDPGITSIEEGMQKIFGTKVAIEQKKKGGRILIEFYSLEDLNRIVKLMIKQ